MSVDSRNKGKVGEREFAALMTHEGWLSARTQQYKGTPQSADIDSRGLEFIHWEVKRREKGNVEHWLNQAEDECGTEKLPIVAHRRSGETWQVTLRATDLCRILRGEF